MAGSAVESEKTIDRGAPGKKRESACEKGRFDKIGTPFAGELSGIACQRTDQGVRPGFMGRFFSSLMIWNFS